MGEQKKVGFWSGHLGERGTDVAMYDYAYYNQEILENESFIFYPHKNQFNNESAIQKFNNAFKVIELNSFSEIDEYLVKYDIKFLYNIKAGKADKNLSKVAKNCIHCVFNAHEPHGDVYTTIAPWVNGNDGKYPVVPHMVTLPNVNTDLRNKLNIPNNATVFGGYGGSENFSIRRAQQAVYKIAKDNPEIYFLFANFNKFCDPLPNIIHLPCIVELDKKVEFINTCDAMIWARKGGEVMSMAMGEFSVKNKPIIAKKVGYRGHVHLLGNKAIWYDNQKNLEFILQNFDKEEMAKRDWNAYSDYTPEKVMKIFDEVFLR